MLLHSGTRWLSRVLHVVCGRPLPALPSCSLLRDPQPPCGRLQPERCCCFAPAGFCSLGSTSRRATNLCTGARSAAATRFRRRRRVRAFRLLRPTKQSKGAHTHSIRGRRSMPAMQRL